MRSMNTLLLLASALPMVAQVPYWTYTTTGAKDGQSYSPSVAGRSPLTRPHSVTVIRIAVVPLVVTLPDGRVLDATAPSPCTGISPMQAALASPLFNATPFTMNGADVGNTQYLAAYQRASFWQPLSAAANSHHTLLAPVEYPALNIRLQQGTVRQDVCDNNASASVLSMTDADQGEIRGLVEAAVPSVDRNTVPVFLLPNIAMGTSGGFHGVLRVPIANTVSFEYLPYMVAAWITGGPMAQSVPNALPLSHELAEWMMNPFISSTAPAWKNPERTGCESALEAADALAFTGTYPAVRMPNGVDYRMAELAFVSYFYHTASIGAGGKFSNNGTLTAMAANCP